MANEPIVYDVARGVATLTFNRPDKLNALTPRMLRQLLDRVGDAAADPSVRVILLTGAGRAFSAGLDLEIVSGGAAPTVPDQQLTPDLQWPDDVGPSLERFYSDGWSELIRCRKPTIAAVNGPAFGWGFVLALHCDIRLAARSALFNATFARLGVPGEKNAAWLLTRLVGPARAADLLYTARRLDGVEAERLGIANSVHEDEELLQFALDYAQGIAANSAPRSLAAMKAQIWTAVDDCYDEAFAASDREQDIADKTSDFREGVASLLGKRASRFTGE